MTTRRQMLVALGAGLLAVPFSSSAQQKPKVWRVGFVASRRRPEFPETDFYGQLPHTLRELGYVEGANLEMVWRFADGDYERLPSLAAELVRLPVDVIVTDGTPGIRAAQAATKAIPIVFAGGSDLVASGIVKSLARPGGNTTGATLMFDGLTEKQLELLSRMVPKLSRGGVLFNPTNAASVRQLKEYQAAGPGLKVEILPSGARTEPEIAEAFSRFVTSRCGAVIWTVDTFLFQQRRQISELSARFRLPSITGYPEYAEAGGLMGYGPNRRNIYRLVAVYVDKVFKGATPGDLPVQQPTKVDLVINGKTAKALGLTIPPELLLLADKVIE